MKAKRMLSLLLTAALMLSMVTPVLAASAETELPRASQTRMEETMHRQGGIWNAYYRKS